MDNSTKIENRNPQISYAIELGITLYRCRLECGLSLRALARRLDMSAHSGLLDYERGHRIPPKDLITAYEDALGLPTGYLQKLHKQALEERADRKTAEMLALLSMPEKTPQNSWKNQVKIFTGIPLMITRMAGRIFPPF